MKCTNEKKKLYEENFSFHTEILQLYRLSRFVKLKLELFTDS